MDVNTMVVIIVLIACGSGVITKYIQRRERGSNKKLRNEVHQELDSLKERVTVLERIVTEKKYRLSDEIDSLDR